MKKTYLNPVTEIINMDMEQMIAASVEGFVDALSDEVSGDGSDALSREFIFEEVEF